MGEVQANISVLSPDSGCNLHADQCRRVRELVSKGAKTVTSVAARPSA